MLINLSSDLDRLTKNLDELGRSQIPFAASLALNNTAALAKKAEREEMSRVFDSPKNYTLNSIFVTPSNKRDLTAVVGLKSGKGSRQGAAEYLRAEITGGKREETPFERELAQAFHSHGAVVPGRDAKLDAFGNVTKAMRKAIIDAENGGKGSDPRGIFIIPVGSNSHLRPGIYQRVPNRLKLKKRRGVVVSTSGGGTRLKVLMLFDAGGATYGARLDLSGTVRDTVRFHFSNELSKAMIRARFSANIGFYGGETK